MASADLEYKKKNIQKRHWCLLFIVLLLLVAVVAGSIIGIVKVFQSSGSSDCTKVCHLNRTCTNVTVNGIVKNEDGILLNDATIALSRCPFNILTRTYSNGRFKLRGICIAQEKIIVERTGYLPQVLNAKKIDSTTFTISASLEAIVFPEVTVHPESKIRVENQPMTLCCAGVGKPDIKYEWILNGRSVSEYQQDESESSKLIIPRLHRSMNGEVKCKVRNKHGEEYSNAAKITVITKKDSCSDKPLQRLVRLPPVCVDEETQSSTVDLGRCGGESCISNSLFSLDSCSDNYCCQSLAEKSIVISCSAGTSFKMTRITSCGCGPCAPKVSTVNGIATGGPNNLPFKYGHFYHAGKEMKTGENGDFFFTVHGDLTRIVVNFKGKDKYNDFQDLTKVVSVVPGRETFVNVRMKPRPQPMLINASEKIEIPMGSSNSGEGQPAPVVLSLPPQSLMTEDGEIYNGTASVEVSFTDPRNETQVQEADGDFTTVNADGEQQLLETFGVFKINFMDSNGKPLQSNAPVDVNLDLDEYDITEKEAEEIKLWYMDEKTGRWRLMDSGLKPHESRRSKRSGRKLHSLGTIDQTMYNLLINLDKLANVCFVKIRVVNYVPAAISQTVKVMVFSTQGGMYRYTKHSVLAGASSCIGTFCLNLKIQAELNQKLLKPNDKNINAVLKRNHGIKYYSDGITVQDILNPTSGGPFFRDSYSCSNSPDKNGLIFDVCSQNGSCIPSEDIRWHKKLELSVCYVKITTENSCRNKLYFHVNSTDVSESPHFQGSTIVSVAKSNISICAEFKCPTSKNRSVLVTITPLGVRGQFTETQEFKSIHEEGGYDPSIGSVVTFNPVYKRNNLEAGIISAGKDDEDLSKNTEFHKKRRKECEGPDTTAGLIFNCA